MSNNVKVYRKTGRSFEYYGGPPGDARISRLIGQDTSNTMGAGIATFDSCSIEWTLLYDEVIIVLEGSFRIGLEDTAYDLQRGDVVWIPERTSLRYEGSGATVFYALYPVDWTSRNG